MQHKGKDVYMKVWGGGTAGTTLLLCTIDEVVYTDSTTSRKNSPKNLCTYLRGESYALNKWIKVEDLFSILHEAYHQRRSVA